MELTQFSQLRTNKLLEKYQNKIYEFEAYYEYCLVDNYEDIFEDFRMDSIQMNDLFVSLITFQNATKLVSLHFPKTYTILEIIEWVEANELAFNTKDEKGYFIENSSEIMACSLFKGKPIVVAKKGKEKIYFDIDEIHEVTRDYNYHPSITNSSKAEKVEINEEQLDKKKIFLNGHEMDTLPRLDIDIVKDEVYVNGVYVFANYIESIEGRIGLFSEFEPTVPIVFLQDDSNIYVETYKKEEGSTQFIIHQEVSKYQYKED